MSWEISGKLGAFLFFSRRAYLLTTASAQTPYPSPRRKRQVSSIPLCLLFPQSQRLCGSPFAGGGIACGNRALCEADVAFCGKRQTMPQHLRMLLSSSAQTANSLRRAQRIWAEIFCPCCRLPAQTCHRQLCRRDGRAFCPSIFSLQKRNRKKKMR